MLEQKLKVFLFHSRHLKYNPLYFFLALHEQVVQEAFLPGFHGTAIESDAAGQAGRDLDVREMDRVPGAAWALKQERGLATDHLRAVAGDTGPVIPWPRVGLPLQVEILERERETFALRERVLACGHDTDGEPCHGIQFLPQAFPGLGVFNIVRHVAPFVGVVPVIVELFLPVVVPDVAEVTGPDGVVLHLRYAGVLPSGIDH